MASLVAWSPEGIRTSTSTTPEEERPGIRWANRLLSPSSPLSEVTLSWVNLTGFEPVTPSLRKMQSKPSDQEKRHPIPGLWRGCGTSVVRHRETLMCGFGSPALRTSRWLVVLSLRPPSSDEAASYVLKPIRLSATLRTS